MLRKPIEKLVTLDLAETMELEWLNFCRTNNVDQRCCLAGIEFDQLEPWWNWVAKNYKEPLPEASSPWGQ